ncbi:MAG: HAD-IC family P-type ATPase [Oscillospiraceae bacterium]|nr:HAD-IC family P-type ATPase [Oscillospiraceae bacterium]
MKSTDLTSGLAHPAQAGNSLLERICPRPEYGLSTAQVQARIQAGGQGKKEQSLTPSVRRIVLKNTLTLFNLLNLFLATVIIIVGRLEYIWNIMFIGVAIANTLMGIFQELKSKKALDKLSILARSRVNVVREGVVLSVPQDNVVLDDVIRLGAGDQVSADGVVLSGMGLEVDESLLTGESDRIKKEPGETVLSGSFVTGGQGFIRAMAVGEQSYANSLSAKAKSRRGKVKSKLLRMMNIIIRVLSVIIIPLGLLLFFSGQRMGEELSSNVLGSAAAVVGMIPSGLVMLTGITLTIGAMNLAKRGALVQSLPSIETLARTDVICLDKTGTITDGQLVFERVEPVDGVAVDKAAQVISELMGTLPDENATAKTLTDTFGTSNRWRAAAMAPFNSERKWSGVTFEGMGSYLLGSPGILLANTGSPALVQANRYAAAGHRVICLAHSPQAIMGESLPPGISCVALLLLSDNIRQDAPDTFRFFAKEGVTLKVISGDNPRTVGAVAKNAGLANTDKTVDMSTFGEGTDFTAIVEETTVFGHTTPQQKLELIKAMQHNGHTTCMTGDGVNDILAMRESNCSVAMVGGSSAARSACDFVLLSSSFSAMISALRQGRRVINNIERVAALYMVNVVFSVLLTLIYTFLPFSFPFAPLQMTPVNTLTTGIPSFFLALQANYERPAGRFWANIFEHAFPAAIIIVFNTLYIQAAGVLFGIPYSETSTMVVFMSGIVGFFILFRVAGKPTKAMGTMLWSMVAMFAGVFFIPGVGEFFGLGGLVGPNVFFYLPLIYISYHIHGMLGRLCRRLLDWLAQLKLNRQAEQVEF